jgi:hypothetical protein
MPSAEGRRTVGDNHPYHSDDTFVKGENALQEFVSPALEMGPEERNRPRYGRPVCKPDAAQGDPPKPTTEPKAEPN